MGEGKLRYKILNSTFSPQSSVGAGPIQDGKVQNMWEQWLRCRVVKGMFSDELAITYQPRGATSATSVFVPKDLVLGEIDNEGKVKVMVFRQENIAWAVLPSAQQTVIPIDEADLTAP
jgi:hypothetical protein